MAGGGMGMGLQRNQSMYPGGPTPFNQGSGFTRPGAGMPFGGGFPGQGDPRGLGVYAMLQGLQRGGGSGFAPGSGGDMSGMRNMGSGQYENTPTPTMGPRMSTPFSVQGQAPTMGGTLPPVDVFPSPKPPTFGGVMGADGNAYADRNSSPRAYTAGPFNPNAGQWAEYGNPNGAPFAQTINGTNYLNGTPWAPEMNNTGGPAFQNFVDHYRPIWEAQQNGTYKPQYAGTGPNTDPSLYAGPGGTMPGSPGVGTPPQMPPPSGLTRGTAPSFDPRLTMSSGIDPNTGLPFSRNPYLK